MMKQTTNTDLEATKRKNAVIFDLEEAKEYLEKSYNQEFWTKMREEKTITIGSNPWYIYEVAFADRSSGFVFEIFEFNKHTRTVMGSTYWGDVSLL